MKRLFRKSDRSLPNSPKLLPESTRKNQKSLIEEESITPQELLGIKVRPGPRSEALVKSFTRDTTDRAVVYHHAYSTLYQRATLDLKRIFFEYAEDITMLIRSVHETPKEYVRHIDQQKSLSNDARTKFLEDVKEWALPHKMNTITGHDLLMWGSANVIVPGSLEEETAALHGKIITYRQYGHVARSVINGLAMDLTDTPIDPITGGMNPVWYSAPMDVVWHDRSYELPHIGKAFAFWVGVIELKYVEQVLELGDLLIRGEAFDVASNDGQVHKAIYFTAVLRVETEMDGENKTPDFSGTAKALAKLGKWELLTKSKIPQAFKAFVPGSAPLPQWEPHFVSKPAYVLQSFSKCLKTLGDRNGNYMVGAIDGQPLLLDHTVRPSILYEGPSKTGKTTKALQEALETTQNVVWFPLTAGEFEAAPKVFKRFGGTVISLNLPDAYAAYDNKNGKYKPEEIMRKQKEFHSADRAMAEEIVTQLEEQWELKERIVGLPLTFSITSGDTIRLFNFYVEFITAFREAWKRWYKKTGEWSILVADNFSALRLSENDPLLGSLPAETGRNLGLMLAWLVSNGRNLGMFTRILTHTKQDLDYITTGLYGSFGLIMAFEHNEFTYAKVFQNGEVYADVVRISLPRSIVSLLGRYEPGEEGNPVETALNEAEPVNPGHDNGQGELEWKQNVSSVLQ